MPYTLFQGGHRRRRRPWRALPALAVLVAVAAALVWVARGADLGALAGRGGEPAPAVGVASLGGEAPEPLSGGGTAPTPLSIRLESTKHPVSLSGKAPRAGVLFDLDTGEVLWRRNPTRPLPIASLTKMMTALVVTERVRDGERVRISKAALDVGGSKMGVLRLGRRIGVNTMLHGLMLPSGNDAAIALADHVAGSQPAFIRLMNRRAKEMGLACTRFSTVNGLRDKGNRSCAADLAALGRAVMREPRLARIVRRRQAILPMPIKGGKAYLYNHNPLLRQGFKGTTGLKTGYTDAAGRCLVATATRGSIRLGVVLLHSPDPGRQAMQLLTRGFRASRG